MLTFESTKTNTPIPQQDLAPILISPPHTYVHNPGIMTIAGRNKRRWHTSIFKQKPTQISCVKQCKINVTHLSKETTQPLCLIRALPAPRVLSTAGKLLWYLRGSYLLPDRNLLFNVCSSDIFLFFLIFPCSLSIVDLLISVLYTQIERSPLAIITRHTPLLLIGCQCVLAHGPTLRSKAFFKNCLVHL